MLFLAGLVFIEGCVRMGIVLTSDAFICYLRLGGQEILGLSTLFLLGGRVIKHYEIILFFYFWSLELVFPSLSLFKNFFVFGFLLHKY